MMAKPRLGSGSKQELVSPCPSLWVRVLQRTCLVPGSKGCHRLLPPPSCWRRFPVPGFLLSREGKTFFPKRKSPWGALRGETT